MTFDEKLKARAAREGSPIPEGFDSRMDALLDTLPAEVQPAKKRRAPRLAVCIGIAAAMVVGAAAAPTVLEMARNSIGYFGQNSGSEYADYQGKYEQFNAAVGMSDTNGDQTLTIDNIAVDDSYLMIFSTLKSEKPLELRDGEYATLSARVKWTAPNFLRRDQRRIARHVRSGRNGSPSGRRLYADLGAAYRAQGAAARPVRPSAV